MGAAQAASGAFVAWIDVGTGVAAYEYPEITGYALTYLASGAGLSPEELEAARRAAEWLAGRVERGLLAARDGWDGGAVYLFDLGVIATGLIAFGRRTRLDRIADAELALVAFVDDALRTSLEAVFVGGPPSSRAGWSTRGVAHLAKLVQPLLLAGGDTGQARRLVDAAIAAQHGDGRMRTDPDEPATMLHPHLYAAEGLWIWGAARADDDALERARAAVDWAWRQQLETGGLPRRAGCDEDGRSLVEQSDVTAQAVRLSLALGRRDACVERALERLAGIARAGTRGVGIPYQPVASAMHLNTWSALFAAQALELALPDAAPLSWQSLV